MEWVVKRVGDSGEFQLNGGQFGIRVDEFEYDGHPDYLWIGLSFRGQSQVEINGEDATRLMTLLSVNGVKSKLYINKNYRLVNEL